MGQDRNGDRSRQFNQYVVKVDGSGRVTLRNRKFLRKYIPVQDYTRPTTIGEDYKIRNYVPIHPVHTEMNDLTKLTRHSVTPTAHDNDTTAPDIETIPDVPDLPVFNEHPQMLKSPAKPASPLHKTPARRSGREKKPPAWHKDYSFSKISLPLPNYVDEDLGGDRE
jgi:hypothetical protein